MTANGQANEQARICRIERQCSTDRLQLDRGLAVNLPAE
ncbi:hypothetical protein PSN_0243 [Pseudomonas sp. NGC7]